MTHKRLLLFPLISVVFLLFGSSQAQNWSGIVDPNRAIDWTTAGVLGGVQHRTTVCSTLNPGATAAQINSAISGCPSGQVVSLNAGTYNLTSCLTMAPNITLRGAGANQTILNFSGFCNGLGGEGTYAIGAEGYYNAQWWNSAPGPFGANPANIVKWTGTNGQVGVYTKGATVLNLASAPSGLGVGNLLFLYQNDDADSAVPESGLFISSCASNCGGGSQVSREGSGYTYGTGERQAVKVTAISGSQVTITPGIYANNWRTSQTPSVYWWGKDMQGVGIEDLAIMSGANSNYTNVSFFEASDSWMSGVASNETASRNHVNVFLSRNITIQNSYFYQSCVGGCGGSSTGYGIEVMAASGTLILNNIFDTIQSPLMYNTGTEGGVTAYNFEHPAAGALETGLASHEEGYLMNLYEGNDFDRVRSDDYHGTQDFTTMFRNRLHGAGGNAAIDIWSYNRYMNVVGNVLGTSGATFDTLYQCLAPTTGAVCFQYNTPNPVYRLGYAGGSASSPEAGVVYDPAVATTLFRWGNYDVISNGVHWCGNSSNAGWASTCASTSEVPTADPNYPNAVPSSTALPASFFLSSKPSFWPSSKPWPAIGPDVSGGNDAGVGGYAYSIPAGDCYTSISGTLASFNENTCYGAPQAPPAPPSGLSATVQ